MDYDNMPAGREMDALVAQKVMGESKWEPFVRSVIPNEPCGTSFNGCPYEKDNHYKYWHETGLEELHNRKSPKYYSTSISSAWEVVEKLSKIKAIWVGNERDGNGWTCLIGEPNPHVLLPEAKVDADGYGESAPLAICRAALKAVDNA